MLKRTTQEVAEYFKNQGCELLGEYTGVMHKMQYRCSCGNVSHINWNHFSNGKRCGRCKKNRIHGRRWTLEEAMETFSNANCTLLATHYESAKIEMPFLCHCGEIGYRTLEAIRKHPRCDKCSAEAKLTTHKRNREKGLHKTKIIRKAKYSTEQVAEMFRSGGCELLDVYTHCETRLKYKCSCGNISQIKLHKFLNGHRCGCKLKSKLTIEEVAKEFTDRGCKLLETEFKNTNASIRYVCKCGRESKTTLSAFRSAGNCRHCGYLKNPRYIKDRTEYKSRQMFRNKCSYILHHTLRSLGTKKAGHTRDLLGYSALELRAHIESHPNWPNVKYKKWHIDHIFPVVAFIDAGIKDTKLINCLENLQPITQKENNHKSAKYDKDKFLAWLADK